MPTADSNCCYPTVFCDRYLSLLVLAYFESHIPRLVVLGAM